MNYLSVHIYIHLNSISRLCGQAFSIAARNVEKIIEIHKFLWIRLFE